MKKILTIVLLVLVNLPVLSAQEDYIFNVKTSKKIINVSNLGIPSTMSVDEALIGFPELLGRDVEEILSNYDVQINGKSIESGRASALVQIQLGDVKNIEISKSPSASEQKKGQGGVINIVLKDAVDGFKGKVTLDASTMVDVMPNFQMTYRKGKVSMYGWLMMEYYHPLKDYEHSYTTGKNVAKFVADTSNLHYGTQNARLNLNYNPTDNDVLKFWLTETIKADKDYVLEQIYDHSVPAEKSDNETHAKSLSLNANAEYKHIFKGKSEFVTELSYVYAPSYTDKSVNSKQKYSNYENGNGINGAVKYKQVFKTRVASNETKLTGGFNYNYSFNEENYDVLHTYGSTLYLSPFVEFEGLYRNWRIQGSARYQYNKFQVKQGEDEQFSKQLNDLTGDLKVSWQLKPHHNLRLILEKTISKPSYYQMYPYPVYRPQQGAMVIGNPDLTSYPTWSTGLNYIFDHNFNKGTFVFNVGVDYRYQEGSIVQKPLLGNVSETTFTYENGGKNNNFCLDFMSYYQYSYFAFTFTANAFSNFENWSDIRSNYGYFNLAFSPRLSFANQWTLSGTLAYYSKVETKTGYLGDAFDGKIRLTKIWNNVNAHVEFNDIFHDVTQDVIYGMNTVTTRYYDLDKRYFQMGVTIKF